MLPAPRFVIPIALSLLLSGCGDAPPLPTDGRIGCTEILQASLDRTHVARDLESHEVSRFFSSAAATNKAMLASYAPHITGDMDHGFFADVRETTNDVEVTLAECRGPGFVSWIWSANPLGELWLYVDDERTPVLRMPFERFLRGDLPGLTAPFAAETAGGFNLHLPLVHSNYVRVALHAAQKADLGTLYFQIAWNALPSNVPLATFSPASLAAAGGSLKGLARVARARLREEADTPPRDLVLPAASTAVVWSTAQPATITNIHITAERREDLEGLELAAIWDEEASAGLEAPLLLLSGASSRGEETAHLLARTTTHGVALRWPMPCERGRMELRNTTGRSMRLRVAVEARKEALSGLRFRSVLTRRLRLPLTKRNVVPLARIDGAGRLAACCLQYVSRTDAWWGEGDVLIRLDGDERTPWHTAGTEDYAGCAWGSTRIFAHPFRGQSVVRYSNEGRTTALHRLHVLDELPFHRQADMSIEVTGLGNGDADLEALVLFYAQRTAQRSGVTTRP